MCRILGASASCVRTLAGVVVTFVGEQRSAHFGRRREWRKRFTERMRAR
jgi:hypothetical protein